jgi:hypothetical protein
MVYAKAIGESLLDIEVDTASRTAFIKLSMSMTK